MNETELICPHCRERLTVESRILACPAGHNFDMAREGYVNLLAGKAPGPSQGDSPSMVQARRAFLARGLYRHLAAAIAVAVLEIRPRIVADFGCGEGYYLGEVLGSPGAEEVQAYGTDISKAAVAAAARRYRPARFAVADTNRLIPLADGSVDVGLCVFAPRNALEFARVIRPGGRLVVVVPGAGHLASLREQFGLLGIEADKAAKIRGQLTRFEFGGRRKVQAEIKLDKASVLELIEMTPNARHLSEAARAALDAVSELTTRSEFEILIFSRRSA